MRIISGRLKGRLMKVPRHIRPTQDKVRKALFDIIKDIEDLSFLELFAGSGAVGLEAASQGANRVVFVENDPICIGVLKDNLAYLHPSACCLFPFDALKAIKKLAKEKKNFDIIFLDPPYCKRAGTSLQSRLNQAESDSISKKTLKMLSTYDILAPNGLIVVQHFKKDILPGNLGDLTIFKQSSYGDTLLSFYWKSSK